MIDMKKETIKKMDDWNRQLKVREYMSKNYCLSIKEENRYEKRKRSITKNRQVAGLSSSTKIS